jgi:hypothetical protein
LFDVDGTFFRETELIRPQGHEPDTLTSRAEWLRQFRVSPFTLKLIRPAVFMIRPQPDLSSLKETGYSENSATPFPLQTGAGERWQRSSLASNPGISAYAVGALHVISLSANIACDPIRVSPLYQDHHISTARPPFRLSAMGRARRGRCLRTGKVLVTWLSRL